jgi:DNA (cytosine-5)-methyltransferase 1
MVMGDKSMKIASFFSGVGGLDLGFTNVGFELAFANDNWKGCMETFKINHKIEVDSRSISNLVPGDIPDSVGFVGGPPCQSWSLAGSMKGINDPRGQVFYDYIRLIQAKKPLFFLAENVAGILSKTHVTEFKEIIKGFDLIGYNVAYKVLNAKEYGVPQDRKRVIIVGYRKDMGKKFEFPYPKKNIISLQESIGDLPQSVPALEKNKTNGASLKIPNHEHMIGGFSSIFMSRNRRREWDQPSFTIQAGGRHAPIHPSSTEMVKIEKDKWKFKSEERAQHRRFSVRECARVQTFPDDFIFKYENISDGYKMIGNAVPVKMAENLAIEIKKDLMDYFSKAK